MGPGGRRPSHPLAKNQITSTSGLVNCQANHLLQNLVPLPQSCGGSSECNEATSGRVAEIEKSAQFVSNKYDEANLAASTALETSKKVKEENLEIRAQIEELRLAADEAAQYSRRNCLIISGIPEMKKDDTDKIVIDIAEKWLDIQLDIGKIWSYASLESQRITGYATPDNS